MQTLAVFLVFSEMPTPLRPFVSPCVITQGRPLSEYFGMYVLANAKTVLLGGRVQCRKCQQRTHGKLRDQSSSAFYGIFVHSKLIAIDYDTEGDLKPTLAFGSVVRRCTGVHLRTCSLVWGFAKSPSALNPEPWTLYPKP